VARIEIGRTGDLEHWRPELGEKRRRLRRSREWALEDGSKLRAGGLDESMWGIGSCGGGLKGMRDVGMPEVARVEEKMVGWRTGYAEEGTRVAGMLDGWRIGGGSDCGLRIWRLRVEWIAVLDSEVVGR
jgi:hypothetical protein